jgi:hypothetical protein
MISQQLASLFQIDPNKPADLALRQGIVQSWDADAADNVIQIAGGTWSNITFLTAEAANIAPGDVVSVLTADDRALVLGKTTTPGDPGSVPTWTADIEALGVDVTTINTVTIPAVQADVTTAQTTAETAATDAATALSTANSAAEDAAEALAAAGSDGNPPASSPTVEGIGGLDIIRARWVPVVNNDPVTYKVHISTSDDFTATADTLVGTTSSSGMTIKMLPGDPPTDPDQTDPRLLQYDTDYYISVVASDADGDADQGPVFGPVQIFQVDTPNIATEAIVAGHIAAGAVDADKLTSSLVLSGEVWTAETGRRTGLTSEGFFAYRSDNSLILSLPNDDSSNALYDGELIMRRGTFTGGASFQSDDNEVTADASLTLMRGITSPSATPQVGVTYDTVPISTASLSNADKTGDLGTFDLVPSEVYCVEWKDAAEDYWVMHQIRPTGTRAWFFRVSDGAPLPVTGDYFTDYTDWAIYSAWEITSGGNAGVYRMARWIPSGAALEYYLWSPAGLNRYSRQNGVASPAIGSDGTSIFTAEVISGSLRVRYWNPDGSGNNLTSPTATFESGQGFATANSLCTLLYGSFDVGANRYAVAQRGVNFNNRLLNSTAGSPGGLYPAGSGNNWGSANREAFSWECPTSNRRGIAWDAGNSCFWTFGADGYMYKHTGEQWDPAVSSLKYWAKLTFYDSDSTGGTHETTPGPSTSYTAKRRAKNYLIAPEIPDNGGTDDPDQVRLYMARGDTAPANSSYHLQYTGSTSTTWTTLATVTATPPTSNNFPDGNPATIRSADGSLVISGDGTIDAAEITVAGAEVAIKPPSIARSVSSTDVLGVTSTTLVPGSPVVGAAFTAPDSGAVMVSVSGHLEHNSAGFFAYLCAEVRAGATVGSGTVVHTGNVDEGIAVGGPAALTRTCAGNRFYVDGLTPGDPYNVRLLHFTQGGNFDIFYRSVMVEPVL